MKKDEIEAFVTSKLAKLTDNVHWPIGILAEHVISIAYDLHDEIAKQNTSCFVDQLQKEGWELREIHTTHKVWGPDDTYENLEFQVFKGPGKYQVFTRPKPGGTHADRPNLDPNGIDM